MPRRAKLEETKADIIDKLTTEVDPIMVAGSVAVAVAGWYGFKGPLTTILDSMNGGITIAQNPAEDPIGYIIWSYPPLGLIRAVQAMTSQPSQTNPSYLGAGSIDNPWASSFGPGTTPPMTDAEKKEYYKAWGRAMSNVAEFMVTYSIARNPGTPDAVMKLVEVLGKSLPGLSGMIAKSV